MTQLFDASAPSRKQEWEQVRLALSRTQLHFLARQLDQAALLDGKPGSPENDHLIFTALPCETLQTSSGSVGPDSLSRFRQAPPPAHLKPLPFLSGFIGYLAYDQDPAQPDPSTDFPVHPKLPSCHISYFSWSYVRNLNDDTGYLTFSPGTPQKTRRRVLDAIQQSDKVQSADCDIVNPSWAKSQSAERYYYAFRKLQDYILAGDVYQANLTQRFEAKARSNIIDYYFEIQKQTQAPYCALLCINPDQHILSFSPEQFIHVRQKRISSKPIKGTISSDIPNAAQTLVNSAKDRAENLMIVDLLRNDISKISQLKSVSVPELFNIERHRDVFHMVSTIQGTLRPGITPYEALNSCFPGGSITGAPKKRAMEIIRELEVHPRSAYCGSLFYWSDLDELDSNILIRSIVHDHGNLFCWGGGGIVADSEAESEYLESILKVQHITGIYR